MHTNTRRVLATALFASLATTAFAQQEGRPGGRQGGPPSAEEFVARMMERDANGDGKLSRDELPGPFAERMFDNNDTNKDGFLDSTELKAAAENFAAQRGNGQGQGRDRAFAPGQARPGGAPDGVDRPGAPMADTLDFEGGMKQAGRAMRSLRRSSFTAESKEGDLENIAMVQQGMLAAKMHMTEVHMAEQAKERFGDDTAKYEAEFRMMLIQTLMESLVLETAVIEGDAEAAKKSVAYLVQLQKDGHNAFQPEEDEDHDEAPAPRSPAGSR